MFSFLRALVKDKGGKVSLNKLSYLLTVVTSIFWINIIFAIYSYGAIFSKPTPDMPSQVVMVILTLLGGYVGAKGMDNFSRRIQDNINDTPQNREKRSRAKARDLDNEDDRESINSPD